MSAGQDHLVKLCVGATSIDDLAHWHRLRILERLASGQSGVAVCHTKHGPKAAAQLIEAGSLYWVIKGQISVRQKIVGFDILGAGPEKRCEILLDPALVPLVPRAMRPFQGWRYMAKNDVPPDLVALDKSGDDGLPQALKQQLADMGVF